MGVEVYRLFSIFVYALNIDHCKIDFVIFIRRKKTPEGAFKLSELITPIFIFVLTVVMTIVMAIITIIITII